MVAAAVLELDSVTTLPDGPAFPLSRTVATMDVDEPPSTELCERVRDSILALRRVSEAVFETANRVAVRVAVVVESTPSVGILNVADVAPAGTVTVAGGITDELFEDRITTAPPGGAGIVKVTVPVGVFPPTSVVGVVVKPARFTPVRVKLPD